LDTSNREDKGENVKEVMEIQPQQTTILPVTRQDMEAMKAQRELLKEFIASQLKEADFSDRNSAGFGEGDFGVIPGTKKKCLLKPGSEKLLRLFQLGVRVRLSDKEIDRHANFALFTYRAEVYHLRTNVVIAECEGSTNSQETKYRERTVWKKKKLANGKEVSESTKEETPIFDVLNTLMKMAQKRAIIGATILATSASDFFTQDMEMDEDDLASAQTQAKTDSPESPHAEPEAAPECCGKTMMVSKYPNKETGNIDWYCLKCKTSKPRAA
jgi:hypothetical protein